VWSHHPDVEQSWTKLAPNDVPDGVANYGGRNDESYEGNNVHTTLARNHARHQHRGLAREHETNKQCGLAENQESHHDVDQRGREFM
jgi:hypothetical protein